MRLTRFILFPTLFFLCILPVILVPPQVTGSPDEIIPTRNLLMFSNFSEDTPVNPVIAENIAVKSDTDSTGPNSPGNTASIPIPSGLSGTAHVPRAVQAIPTPVPTPPMAKGWAQVYMTTDINSPEQMVEDRQRLMASGLFNVHVYHQFAG